MYRLPWFLIGLLGLISLNLSAQNPHGDGLTLSCVDCHTTDGWSVNLSDVAFDHNEDTEFALEGRHASITCADCHKDLVFEETPNQCVDCHIDVHAQTVGNDCVRCHTSESWLVNQIPEIHDMNGFALQGTHALANCVDCHQSANMLAFNSTGNQCVDCHRGDYLATTNPNHQLNGFSMECADCHNPISQEWLGEGSHFFFPLVDGHDGPSCVDCHNPNEPFSAASPECISCHLEDYQATTNPNHAAAGISMNCTECHDLSRGWSPVTYDNHDNVFPIYSGKHKGEWNDCVDCHNNSSNFLDFSCIDCHAHTKSRMDDEHDDVGSYQYNSQACYSCHPNGKAD